MRPNRLQLYSTNRRVFDGNGGTRLTSSRELNTQNTNRLLYNILIHNLFIDGLFFKSTMVTIFRVETLYQT